MLLKSSIFHRHQISNVFQGGISTLNSNFSKEHREAKDELEKKRERTEMILMGTIVYFIYLVFI